MARAEVIEATEQPEVSERTNHRSQYVGMKVDDVKRLKELEAD